MGGPRGPGSTWDPCTHCGKLGHTEDVCRSKARALKVCSHCGFQGHLEAECRKKKAAAGLCTRCNVPGHPATQCPYKDHLCGHCNVKGHSEAACRHLHNPKKTAVAAAAAAQATSAVPGLGPGTWRCCNKKCGIFNNDPSSKSCVSCNTKRSQEDVDKAVPLFPALKKAGTEVVDLLTSYTGGACPVSKEDQEILDQKANLEKHIKILKDAGLNAATLEEQLKALKIPDVANNHLKFKTSLDARLLEIEQKAATAKTQFETQIAKLDTSEQQEVDTLEAEVKAWWEEFEIKRNVARADRAIAKTKYDADRKALLEKDRLRILEQESLTAAARASLNNLGQAASPTTQSQSLPGLGPTTHPIPPPLIAVLPSMVSLQDIQAHLVSDSTFSGTSAEAEAFAQSMLVYLDKKVIQHVSRDTAMVDPDLEVEFSDETDNDVESGPTASATKIRKKYKMKASERDARVLKKIKGKASTDA